jgi:hypothetical protein
LSNLNNNLPALRDSKANYPQISGEKQDRLKAFPAASAHIARIR